MNLNSMMSMKRVFIVSLIAISGLAAGCDDESGGGACCPVYRVDPKDPTDGYRGLGASNSGAP